MVGDYTIKMTLKRACLPLMAGRAKIRTQQFTICCLICILLGLCEQTVLDWQLFARWKPYFMQVSLQHYNVFSWKICEFTSFRLVEGLRLCSVLPLARVLIETLCLCNKFFRKILHLNCSVKWGKMNLFINRLLLHRFRIWSHNQFLNRTLLICCITNGLITMNHFFPPNLFCFCCNCTVLI